MKLTGQISSQKVHTCLANLAIPKEADVAKTSSGSVVTLPVGIEGATTNL
jgi:hypothetical protein